MGNDNKKCKPELLLVEPNDHIRRALRTAFQKTGYYIIAVDSAKHGSQILAEENFDVIICDFDLYDGTGKEFLGSLKDTNADKTTVLMVSHGDIENHSDLLDQGIDHVIEKPFLFERLLSIVKDACDQKLVA